MQASLVLTLLAFTTASVSGRWLDPSPHHSFEDYCQAKGAQINTPHVCFTTNPDFFAKIDVLIGDGYPAPGLRGFALIPSKSVPQPWFTTANNKVTVKFENPAETNGKQCAWVLIEPLAGNEGKALEVCQDSSFVLPKNI